VKTVLFIAYHYPPVSTPGAARARAFVRDLPASGYGCRIITTATFGGMEGPEVRRAAELVGLYRLLFNREEGREEEEVRSRIRTRAGALGRAAAWSGRRLLIPDGQIAWVPDACRKALAAAHGRTEVVYTTSPPHSAHLVGRVVQAATGLPWVAEFRDTWTYDPLDPELSSRPLRRRVEAAMESMVLRRADRVVGVTTIACQVLRGLGGGDRVREVTNGFDGEPNASPPRGRGDRMRLVHAGSFSYSHPCRSPETLLRATERAPKEVELVLVGSLSEREKDMVRSVPGARATGPLERDLALAWQARADVLVLVDHARSVRASNVPSKCYDYLAAGRPILALTPDGATKDLIEGLGAGLCVPPEDVGAASEALHKLHAAWRDGALSRWTVDPRRLAPFSRRQTARCLAGVFDEVTGSRSG
jgi:glycosyltransferase involved in cell wall biosynthesis